MYVCPMRGSKRRKANGRWELRVYLGRDPVTGAERRRSRTIPKCGEREANRQLAAFVTETAGQTVTTEATVATLLARWMRLIERDRSPTTAYGYQSKIRTHILPALGDVPLAKLDGDILDGFYETLGERLAPASVRQVHAILQAALGKAVKWGWVDRNVAKLATPPGVPKVERHMPDVAAVQALALAAREHDPELATMIGVLLKLGCRRGELCGLQWRDVDLEAGEVRIRRAVVQTTGELVVKDTKSHAGRVVTIDGATVEALAAHRVVMAERGAVSVSGFVFSRHPEGLVPVVPDVVSKSWARLCKREGLAGVRLHDLRHLHATVLLNGGVPMATVTARLGHLNETTTRNIYSHTMRASDRRAAEVAGELL